MARGGGVICSWCVTEVVEEHFGVGAGKLITLLYFFAIYPILLVYSVAITNTVESFMIMKLSTVLVIATL